MISSLRVHSERAFRVTSAGDYTRFLTSLTSNGARDPAEALRTHTKPGLVADTTSSGALVTPAGFEQWLPFAAEHYKISRNIGDYFLRTVPLFVTDLPNRNGVGFPARELARWSEEGGCQAFMTWKGKPLHVEHKSDDPTQAIGVIVDVAMLPLRRYGNNKLWKVLALNAVDRTKRTDITSKIESGARNTWSMGAMVSGYTCSYCGAEVGECSHIDKDANVVLYEKNGKLVYKLVYGVTGYEFSSVADPAYGVALSDTQPAVLSQ